MIHTENLTKIYANGTGCKDVSITIEKGQIFGLLGPNGAGKSTFVKMIIGLITPTSGTARILGKPINNVAVRKKIGYLPERFKYQQWMTGKELLSFHAELYKMDFDFTRKINEVLKLVHLNGKENNKIETYSKGMQQRLGIASVLLNEPDLIIFDEPTSALDPLGRKEIREIILKLKRMQKTILLNSHLLSEVEMICDQVAIINAGRVIKQGSLQSLLNQKTQLQISVDNIKDSIIQQLLTIDNHLVYDHQLIKMTVRNTEEIAEVAEIIINQGGRLYELTPEKASLEAMFINLIEGRDTDVYNN